MHLLECTISRPTGHNNPNICIFLEDTGQAIGYRRIAHSKMSEILNRTGKKERFAKIYPGKNYCIYTVQKEPFEKRNPLQSRIHFVLSIAAAKAPHQIKKGSRAPSR